MIEVLREGEPTLDGRFINHGAIELPDGSVPLFDFDRRGRDADQYSSIGELFNFTRGEDDRIYCETTLKDDDRTVTVTVAIDERLFVGGEELGIARGRIIGGVVGDDMKYPWKL
jgi:hypothetical protein